jgi:hypothetical protein
MLCLLLDSPQENVPIVLRLLHERVLSSFCLRLESGREEWPDWLYRGFEKNWNKLINKTRDGEGREIGLGVRLMLPQMSPHQVTTPSRRPLKLTLSPANLSLPLEDKSSPVPHALPPQPTSKKMQKTSVLSFLKCKRCPSGMMTRKL